MALSSNQILAGVAGAGVVFVAAYALGRHQGVSEPVTAPAALAAASSQALAPAASQAVLTESRGTEAAREAAPSKPAPMARTGTAQPPMTHQGGGKPPVVAGETAPPAQAAAPRLCAECATVVSVRAETRQGEASALGTIGGAVVGGLLGNQIGGGTGRKIATVGGAVAGGYAGREIEKRANSHQVWVVRLRYGDQSTRSMELRHDPGLRSGDVVRVRDGQIERQ
ncbi:glycine zipper 2TM domain-containing protein [Pelomonas sp. CA6]|uniref:glycine zipper 2TM domain-containing protein n=1 Tax=Pelomonas sp. CA6 TaxID=2907999 RepID=UPI001F4ACE2A|nr:glycine zipper 2TM domain-containing protein [Pelomonas sp. CA6]MCH7342492.1 glycine zipper 2TM domain-containing protein [Pelomonas sp. CA6]